MRVTDRLASHFIDENLRDREILAQGTSQFLTVQLEDARRRLIEQEKKLEEYRLRHSGELPSQAAGNLQQVQNLQLQVQNVVESLNRDVDRKLIIERALADLKAADAQAVASAAPAAPGDNSDQPVTVQLAAAEKYLSELQLRLTPEHPDVIRLKRRITGLKQRAEAEALAAPLSPESTAPRTPAEMLQRNRERALQLELESLDRQIANKRAEEQRLRESGRRLSGANRGCSRARNRADRADARSRNRAEDCTQICWRRTKSRKSRRISNGARSASSSRFSIRRVRLKSRSVRIASRINLLGVVGGLMLRARAGGDFWNTATRASDPRMT